MIDDIDLNAHRLIIADAIEEISECKNVTAGCIPSNEAIKFSIQDVGDFIHPIPHQQAEKIATFSNHIFTPDQVKIDQEWQEQYLPKLVGRVCDDLRVESNHNIKACFSRLILTNLCFSSETFLKEDEERERKEKGIIGSLFIHISAERNNFRNKDEEITVNTFENGVYRTHSISSDSPFFSALLDGGTNVLFIHDIFFTLQFDLISTVSIDSNFIDDETLSLFHAIEQWIKTTQADKIKQIPARLAYTLKDIL